MVSHCLKRKYAWNYTCVRRYDNNTSCTNDHTGGVVCIDLKTLNDGAILGHLEVVKLLVAHGADVNARTTAHSDYPGRTPLVVSAANGFIEIVSFLIEKGANVNTPTADGRTALHVAVSAGHLDIVELLISKGADVKARSAAGLSPFGTSVIAGHSSITKCLWTHGAMGTFAELLRETDEVSFRAAVG